MLALFVLASVAEGAAKTRGYMKKNGTYVMPHYKSKRDGTRLNNYSTKGNVNPYTGKKGYKKAEIKGIDVVGDSLLLDPGEAIGLN